MLFSIVMPDRIVLLIDAQNAYMSARRVFGNPTYDPPEFGQFHPMTLASMLVTRKAGAVLDSVHVFRGRPNRHIDPRGYQANLKQCQAWASAGVYVHARQLRYLGSKPTPADGEEKGVDVELAVHLVSTALRGAVDGVILFSADTDLIPAVDEALARSSVRIEVTGWHNGKRGERLNVPGRSLWCHWLDKNDYSSVEDPTQY